MRKLTKASESFLKVCAGPGTVYVTDTRAARPLLRLGFVARSDRGAYFVYSASPAGRRYLRNLPDGPEARKREAHNAGSRRCYMMRSSAFRDSLTHGA